MGRNSTPSCTHATFERVISYNCSGRRRPLWRIWRLYRGPRWRVKTATILLTERRSLDTLPQRVRVLPFLKPVLWGFGALYHWSIIRLCSESWSVVRTTFWRATSRLYRQPGRKRLYGRNRTSARESTSKNPGNEELADNGYLATWRLWCIARNKL